MGVSSYERVYYNSLIRKTKVHTVLYTVELHDRLTITHFVITSRRKNQLQNHDSARDRMPDSSGYF